jgi:hypothetical protein
VPYSVPCDVRHLDAREGRAPDAVLQRRPIQSGRPFGDRTCRPALEPLVPGRRQREPRLCNVLGEVSPHRRRVSACRRSWPACVRPPESVAPDSVDARVQLGAPALPCCCCPRGQPDAWGEKVAGSVALSRSVTPKGCGVDPWIPCDTAEDRIDVVREQHGSRPKDPS